MSNKLSQQTSPYLLQHANNPVHWYPWADEAIALAKAANKPILVSIGYATCHWCHVMEHESFENQATADIMNKYFINIKVDREERPDIDHLYMDALQAMTGSGGWPLNMFLTPNLEPFYGGTYFPPERMHNRASWADVLMSVNDAWQNRRNEIEAQGYEMIAHLQKQNSFGNANTDQVMLRVEDLLTINTNLLSSADTDNGGFGTAPKFPQFHSLTYLIRHAYFFKDQNAVAHVTVSLTKMIEGGIFDQLAGGIARYSTDNNWLVPHFEKMLYDNALFISTSSEAYQLTQNELLKTATQQTIQFLNQTFLNQNGLYYSAMDADSEGIEGKFYCWSMAELKSILAPQEYDIITQHYDISGEGNFFEPHHNWRSNILAIKNNAQSVATALGMQVVEVNDVLNCAKSKLLEERGKRVAPIIDTKCILSSNALLISGLVKAAESFNEKTYLQQAIDLSENLWQQYFEENSKGISHVYHQVTNQIPSGDAFLDDLANFSAAIIALHNATLNEKYTARLQSLLAYINLHFIDEANLFYYFNKQSAKDVLVRKTEVYDGATPSANAVMSSVLIDSGIILTNLNLLKQANEMLKNLLNPLLKHSNSFAVWASVYQKIIFTPSEIKVNNTSQIGPICAQYMPFKVLIINILSGIQSEIVLCKNQVCFPPFISIEAMLQTNKLEEEKSL